VTFSRDLSSFCADRFYGDDIRASEILSGQVESTSQCTELYSMLALHDDMFDKVLEAKGRQAIARGSRMTGVSYHI